MILPIVAFGSTILRKKCENINHNYPDLDLLINNMWETMYNSNGVGLAAPQVNIPIRMFIIDTKPFSEDSDEEVSPIKKIFINPKITSEDGEFWIYKEGCLSIPDIREDIKRKSAIKIEYYDENFIFHTESYDGLSARVIQHEYDHIEGKLFVDYISPLRKRFIKRKLEDISRGKIKVSYKMNFSK